LKSTQKMTRAAMLIAVCIVLGYLFIFIPNLEMITASIFLSGVLMGPLYGLFIGFTAETIFSLFNSMGAPLPPLLIAQVISMSLVGYIGGLMGEKLCKVHFFIKKSWIRHFILGVTGAALTLVYDILTNLSFLFIAGIVNQPLHLYLLAGLIFSIFHIITNAAIFALVVPVLIGRLKTWRTT